MPRAASNKVGLGKCPECGADVWHRKTTSGMLFYRCESCDSNGYAEPGGLAYQRRMASIAEPVGVASPPPPSDPIEPKAKPARKTAGTAANPFSLGAI